MGNGQFSIRLGMPSWLATFWPLMIASRPTTASACFATSLPLCLWMQHLPGIGLWLLLLMVLSLLRVTVRLIENASV